MRWLFVVLLVVPTGQALTVAVNAPDAVLTDGTPGAATVTVREASGPVEVKAWLGGEDWQASRTFNGTAFQRSDFYALEVEPGPDGRWTGTVWVRANPGSSNADRLAAGELVWGAGARTDDERAEAHARVDRWSGMERGWAAAGPNRSLRVVEDGDALLRLGSPTGVRPIRVPAPVDDLEVCAGQRCGPASGWQVTRADEAGARVQARDEAAGRAVLVSEGSACVVQAGANASRVNLTAGRREEGCREAREPKGLAELFARGQRLVEVPDRAGRGDVVYDPVRGGWAPWRLPGETSPEPLETVDVEGRGRVFATESEGFEVLGDVLSRAQERVTVSTYLLSSRPVAELLAKTARRGVDVHLSLEPDPIGGLGEDSQRLVEWLRGQGVDVDLVEDPSDGGLMHAKVVVVDSSLVLVVTENLTNHGFPTDGEGNVGAGVVVANASLARRIEQVFRPPGEAREIQPDAWPRLEAPVTVVTAPENAWRVAGVPAWIEAQEGPVHGAVLRANARWGPRENPWLSAMVNLSRDHGVEVLLSGAPENAARSNRQALGFLQAHPSAGNLTARLADPRRGTVHAKVLAGPDGVLVGSTNWGLGGAVLNREVNLLIEEPALADDVRAIVEGRADEPAVAERVRAQAGGPSAGLVGVALAATAAAGLRSWRCGERGRGR